MPRRRKLGSEATGYPSPEEFKNIHRRIPPPVPSGLEPYLDYEDAAQPLLEDLKARGPLDRTDYLLIYRLACLRKADATREEFHKQDARAEGGHWHPADGGPAWPPAERFGRLP